MLEDTINKGYIEAMKAKDRVRSSTLNFLRAEIKNLRIEKRDDQLDEQDVIAVIKKQVKQRQDSIEQFKQGGRDDLVEKEEAELAILKSYLPEEMSEDALQKVVNDVIQESGAASMKDMGTVMKTVLEKVAGQADNKMVSGLVKKILMDQ